MAQTTGVVRLRAAKLEVSTNGSSWTDISGSSVGHDAPEQTRETESQATLGSTAPIILGGNLSSVTITVNGLYTEVTGEGFPVVLAAHEDDGALYLRYSPKGGASGDFMYTTASDAGVATAGTITSFVYPASDAEATGAARYAFTVEAPKLLKSVIAP